MEDESEEVENESEIESESQPEPEPEPSFKEIRYEEEFDEKVISSGHNLLNFLAKGNKVIINGGYHIIKINNHIENLEIEVNFKDLIIKAPIDNLKISGGKSNIYIHYYSDTYIKNFYIIGGTHLIEIHSYVANLEIHGGINDIICNYIHSKIDNIKTIGGKRNFYLNNETDKCNKETMGGECNFIKTEIINEGIQYQADLEDGDITPIEYLKDGGKEDCRFCLEKFKKNEKIYILPCGHIFHTDCLKKYFMTKNKYDRKCILCKKVVENKLVD